MKVKAIVINRRLSVDRPGDVCYLELPYNDNGYMRYADDRWVATHHFRCNPCDFKILAVKTYYEL